MRIVAGGIDSGGRTTASLSREELVVCSFGPAFFRGVFWGSTGSMVLLLGLMRRTHRRGLAAMDKVQAEAEHAKSRIARSAEALNRHSPEGTQARSQFVREQLDMSKSGIWYSIFGKSTPAIFGRKNATAAAAATSGGKKPQLSMWDVAPVNYALARVCAILASIKLWKMYLSGRRWFDFVYEETVIEMMADDVLAEAERLQKQLDDEEEEGSINSSSSSSDAEPKSSSLVTSDHQKQLQLLDDAVKVRALQDFKRVAELQQQVAHYDEIRRIETEGYVQPESDWEFRRMQQQQSKHGKDGIKPPGSTHSPSSQSSAAVPTFADGVMVGIWGHAVDAWCPTKPIYAYLGMRAGH